MLFSAIVTGQISYYVSYYAPLLGSNKKKKKKKKRRKKENEMYTYIRLNQDYIKLKEFFSNGK